MGSVGIAVASTPEFCGSNPVIGKISVEHLFAVNCIENMQIKRKEAGNGPLKNSPYILVLVVVVIIKSVSLRNILQVLSDCSKETSMMLGYEGMS